MHSLLHFLIYGRFNYLQMKQIVTHIKIRKPYFRFFFISIYKYTERHVYN